MTNNYTPAIETVVVEVNGRALDSVSFTSPGKAEAYKRSVRQWAAARGVVARVFTEVKGVSRKAREPRTSSTPLLALA